MQTETIAALLDPFLAKPLREESLQQISIYIDLLRRWNARINLTAVRDPQEIVTRHFGESLFLARHLFPNEPRVPHPSASFAEGGVVRVLDIGSGAGFPGLPLKIWAPQIRLTLIESNHKKAAFLREVIRTLTLTNVDVITERAETLAARIETSGGPPTPSALQPTSILADIVTLRAVERFDTILPVAARLVAPGGRLALLIGSSQLNTLGILSPGFHPGDPISVPQSQFRVVSILVQPR